MRRFLLGLMAWLSLAPMAWAAERPAHWHDVDSSAAALQALAQGGTVRLREIGRSGQNRQLTLASLGAADAKRRLLLICGEHGDEFDSVQACHYLLQDLAELSRHDAAWQARLAAVELQILPVMNPDGLVANQRNNAAGVNLNGNWGEGWDAPLDPALLPLVRQPEGRSWRGPAPFSEPETRAVRDLVAEPGLAAFVDYHTGNASFAQGMVLYPFTHAAEDRLTPAQRRLLAPLAREQARLLSVADEREAFVALQTHQVLPYLQAAMARLVPRENLLQVWAQLPPSAQAPGSSIDWVFASYGVPALGFEVSRPFGDLAPARIANFNRYYERLGPALIQAMAALIDRVAAR